ncbi:GTPase Era [Clostridium cylindrosporum]|uniref:GTPase Era n=1 Tax=Clostridium cylindrosporum DSM 605 TaxID=1121307 RepID=A0A0J8D704_CLOCY|nr:GTPase Era [Clostridium cylindrosporum]KMT21657.1 GTPase Era [Clostridium cylindrosporum DSM 605]
MSFKSGFVTIVGRPNVGKSTLMNNIVGEKLSIISNKPQTTRNKIQTILTKDDYQIVFVDTPGIHKPRHKLGEYMVNVAENTLNEVDVVLFLTTPEKKIGPGDRYILEQLKRARSSVFLVINKVDTVNHTQIAQTIKSYTDEYEFEHVIPISAMKDKNVDTLLGLIVDKLPTGPMYYPEDMITDQPERFIVAEIIREKMLHSLKDEVPHGTAVEVMIMKKDDKKDLYHINATIYCEKDSHKSIIIGKAGTMIKQIGEKSRKDIEKFVDAKVFLELWVKVKKDWRDSVATLKTLGYQK